MTSSRFNNVHDMFLILTVDCGNLTDPANGNVTHTTGTDLGQTATYRCDTGYNLVGDRTRTCQARGNWSGNAPTCQGMFIMCMHTNTCQYVFVPCMGTRVHDDTILIVEV